MDSEANPDLPWIASVCYLEYGNLEERIIRTGIYRYEFEFQLVPPQAILCRLCLVCERMGPLSSLEMEDFVELMKKH